jgi:hypothetical protein
MIRKDARALAKTTLEGLGLFDSVLEYEPDTFSGAAIATVHSKSLSVTRETRDLLNVPGDIWVSVYVRRPAGSGATTEDALDDLVQAAMLALAAAFDPEVADLQIGPSETGYPPKPIDGKPYRMERFPVRFDDEQEL